MKQFTTRDRRMEQFLFAHFIRFDHQYKDSHGFTVWSYLDTPWLRQVVAEYARLTTSHTRRA